MKTKRKEKVRMKVPSAKECECGYGLATEIEADGGRICLRCAMLLGCAAEMGVTASEFAAVPVKKRLAFLNERLNLAVISGKYEINADWARKVWTMLDQIKVDRARAGLPSVSRYQTS